MSVHQFCHFMSVKCCLLFIILSVLCIRPVSATEASILSDTGRVKRTHSFFMHISESDKAYFTASAEKRTQYQNNTAGVQLKKGTRIFGWHPYWMQQTYLDYNYALLTHVAYFSGEVSSSGNFQSLNGWDTSAFVSYVKKKNSSCKVLLTASCFNAEVNNLLNDSPAQALLIDNLYKAITSKKGDGICVDFEGISSANREHFTDFISDLADVFKKTGLIVSITLPAVDYERAYAVEALKKNTDFFILMGYDYFGSFSKDAGPVSPLVNKPAWITESIQTSVNYYLGNKVPDSLLLLGVPYFGSVWSTTDTLVPSAVTGFIGYRPYSYGLKSLKGFKNDTSLKASYFAFPMQDNVHSYRQFWMDGVYSLGEKYDYVLQKKLGGVAIWALGFDRGTNNLWELLQDKFAARPGTPVTPSDANNKGTIAAMVQLFEAKPVASSIIVFMLLTTLLVVLIKVLWVPANTAKLKLSGMYPLFLLITVLIFCFNIFVLLLFCFCLTPVVSIGISIGLALSFLLIRVISAYRGRNMP